MGEAVIDLPTFRRGLDYMSLSLGHEHKGHLTITLPGKVWRELFYEVAKLRVYESERSGNGGVLVDAVPPEGKSRENGFWLHGHWIEAMPE